MNNAQRYTENAMQHGIVHADVYGQKTIVEWTRFGDFGKLEVSVIVADKTSAHSFHKHIAEKMPDCIRELLHKPAKLKTFQLIDVAELKKCPDHWKVTLVFYTDPFAK